MTRWSLHYTRDAVDALYHKIARIHVREVSDTIRSLAENPWPENAQSFAEDPSLFWLALPYDHIVVYEIIDERHVVRIVHIE